MDKAKKIILVLFLCLVCYQTSNAQNTKEYYQSLFLLKFIKYSNWTPTPNYYVIGVIGNSPVIPYLKAMTKNKRINGKPVIFKKVSSYANLDKYTLLYIPKNQNSKFKYIISKTRNKSILIISEDDKFIRKGAAICFFEKNKALKFKINTNITKGRKIQISRRLLSVGNIVR